MGKSSKKVENTVGKGEIAHYEQFLLFPLCFQKSFTVDTWKPGLVCERVNKPEGKCLYKTGNAIYQLFLHFFFCG